MAVVALPLLSPKGPGHSAPVDGALAMAIVGVLLWGRYANVRLHLPYVVATSALMACGLSAGLFGASPTGSAQAVL